MLNMKDVDNDVPCNMSEICRLCLSKDAGILPIFGEEESGNQSVPLSFRILACVSIEVSVSDGLPKLICQNCLAQVNTWHLFKQVCDSSQTTLKEWLSKLQEQTEPEKTIEVKQEPPDEDDMIEIHDDVDSGENSVLLDIKQEDIEVCDIGGEEDLNNIEILHDPLSLTTIDTTRVLPVRPIKSEPIDADFIEDQSGADILKDSDKADPLVTEDTQCFDEISNTHVEVDKEIKVEPGNTKKKPKKRKPLTLRKKRPSSTPSETSPESLEENTVLSSSKQQYFCFPAADGKQHYYCIPCGKSFPFRSYYMRHEKVHRKTNHLCTLCDRQFSCQSNLDRHVRLHTGQKPYTCKDCSEDFQNKSEYMKHKNTCSALIAKQEPPKAESSSLPQEADSNSREDSYPCYICRQTFDSIHRLQVHRRSHEEFSCRRCGKSFNGGIALSNHLRTHNFDGFKRYSCKICKKTFSNVTSLVSHKRFHTMRENVAASKTISKPVGVRLKPPLKQLKSIKHLNVDHSDVGVRGYNCTVCKKWVKTQSVLRRHMTSHTKLKLFTCVICNISMGYASSLHKHMRLAHNVEISYRDIHSMFNIPALAEQEALCSGEKNVKPLSEKLKFHRDKNQMVIIDDYDIQENINVAESTARSGCTCNTCFKSFSNKRLLENHMKIIHMGGRAYKCNICSKLFAYRHLLIKHAKIHSGIDEMYTCHVCARSFPDLKTLNNHKGVHTRFKYYSCPICFKSFNGVKNWEQHQRLHNSSVRFGCKLCGKTFLSKADLHEHKKMHIKLKIYTCGVCKNSYNSTSTLNRHKRKKHGCDTSEMSPYEEQSEYEANEDNCYICNTCGKPFTDPVALNKHKLIHIKRDFSRMEERSGTSLSENISNNSVTLNQHGKYYCVLCNRDFPDQSSLSKHKGWHSRKPSVVTAFQLPRKKLLTCGFCKRSFANNGSLSKHRRLNCPPKRSYNKNLLPQELAPTRSVLPSVKAKIQPVKKAPQLLKETLLSGRSSKVPSFPNAFKSGGRYFPCPMCERIFSNKKALIRHKGWHTRCPTLGKEQTPPAENPAENIGTNVILEPVQSKRRTCDVCFKIYSSSSTLSRHKRLHTRKLLTGITSIRKPIPIVSDNIGKANSDALHTCRYCRKAFRFRRNLVDHERVHTGERPFSCNLCSLSFSRRAILWRHKKTHLGFRPYSCTLCSKTFLMNFQLTRHIAEKHTPKDIYACHRCDKTYRTLLALRKHEESQHPAE